MSKVVFISDDLIQQVQKQTDATYEIAKEKLIKSNGDVLDAITELLDIPIKKETKPKSEWDERREICTEMEHAMNSYINQCGTVQHNKNMVTRSIPKPKNMPILK